jgi:hypothetical protein
MTAIIAMPLVAAASLALDITAATLEATKLQDGLDAASLASLKTFAETGSVPEATEAARGLFGVSFHNQFADTELTESGRFDIALDLTTSSLEETATATYSSRYRPVLLPWGGFDISRQSVAVRIKPMESCILALHPSASRAFNVSGTSNVNLKGCTVTANSSSNQAISIGGAAKFSARCLVSHGGIAMPSSVDLDCRTPLTDAPAVPDPFADRAIPRKTSPVLVADLALTDTLALLPGTYAGMKVSGKAALAPGNYIIDGGKLSLTQDADLSGKGVTFFLINGAELDIHGEAVLKITPPTQGTWAGFIIVAERGNTNRAVINGNSNSSLNGIIYMPDAKELHYSGGGSTGGGGCVRLVAQEITLIGTSKFSIDCGTKPGGNSMYSEATIRLAQ